MTAKKGRGKGPVKRTTTPKTKKVEDVSQKNPEDLFDEPLTPTEQEDLTPGAQVDSDVEMVSIPKSDLEEMRAFMRSMKENKSSSSDIQLLAEALKANGSKATVESVKEKRFDQNNQFIFSNDNYSVSDESDILDDSEIVTFFAYNFFHTVAAYTKNGRPIGAPYKPIDFTFMSSQTERSGREDQIIHMCRYTCKSKAELEFLKGSPEFGITFFDNPSFDKKKRTSISRIIAKMNSMARTGASDLRRMCQENDIPFHTDLEALKGEIATKLVEREDLDSASYTQSVLNEAHLERKDVDKL